MANWGKELGTSTHKDGDIVGEILGDVEALEAIGRLVLEKGDILGEWGMGGKALSAESIDSVEDRIAFDLKAAGDCADGHSVAQAVHDELVGEYDLGVVIELESLWGERGRTELTEEPLDLAECLGGMGAVALEPYPLPLVDGMERAMRIRAERGSETLVFVLKREVVMMGEYGHTVIQRWICIAASKSLSCGTVYMAFLSWP
jgi:hypothetical protein